MYLRRYGLIQLLAILALSLSGIAIAQDAKAPVSASGQNTVSAVAVVLHGHVTDPTGALIAQAKIFIVNSAGTTVATATSDSSGFYEIRDLRPATYSVQVVSKGFAPAFSSVTLASNQTKRMDIAMAIQEDKENVVVSDETQGVSVDPSSNVGALVLKGSDLDALSDDPDALSDELNALAGPSAGPNGGQIYIDGFTGGTLPAKSSILEIRINSSPFSAAYDRAGFGRIEIITKPGTDQLHGRGFMQGNDKAFNTGNPFTKNIPDYHSIMMNGNVSGSYKKRISYFISADVNDNQDASVYSADVPAYDSVTGLYYIPYDSNGNIIAQTGSLFSPSKRWDISPRFDFQIGSKNVISTRLMYNHSTSRGSIGSTSLPSLSSSSKSTGFMFQGSDAIAVNSHLANDLRIQYRRSTSSSIPVSTAPMVSVTDYFSGGGSSSQSSSSHSDHIELQDEFTLSAGPHAIKFGTWLRDNREAQFSNSGFNGSFTFISLEDYVNTLNGTPSAQTLSYTTGNTKYKANVFDAAAYLQDDWKVNKFLTLSGGLRFESQNHIKDHDDFGPRIALAYALDGHKNNKTKTVVRVGYGFFYDRFGVGSLMSLESNGDNPNSQTQIVITNPACFNATSLSNINLSTCGTGTSVAKTVQQLAPGYHSPYMEQFSSSLERQLSKKITFSASYMHTYGVHQTITRNANAYLPGTYRYGDPSLTGTRPNAAKGIIDETDPEAIYKENQLTVMVNERQWSRFTVTGFYEVAPENRTGG
jgi:hypothetical protein